MKLHLLFFIFLVKLIPIQIFAQTTSVELYSTQWQFKQSKAKKWHNATIPGSVYSDLLSNHLIPDPYFGDNESKLKWIDTVDWVYKTKFHLDSHLFAMKNLDLVFDGLDTYAHVYLNGKLILQANNMFRQWKANAKPFIKNGWNEIRIIFRSAQKMVDSIALSKLPLVLPDNNRVYVRKAQFQFGWDWGPKFVNCGIWKKARLECWDEIVPIKKDKTENPFAQLVQQKDSIGTSFYFEKDGKPIYAKGVNWIPGDALLRHQNKKYYLDMLTQAKEANVNMIRVWGGGIYEDDAFYDLCDQMGIIVWQDFMFAGGMYPGDTAYITNVREEVKYQIQRLKHHPSIVLWCGNNEVEEAWKNWGWQKQFNLHGDDSIKVWNDYQRLFQDSLKKWVNEFDGTRQFVSTSPKNGWGHKESFTEGDSHYWGLWWGLEDWEIFETKTGRFVSEYGMQAMPNWNTIKSFTNSADRYLYSSVVKAHQKASDGFKKLNHYLTRYFIDSNKLNKLSLEDYTYLSQCMQYYILKNCIAIHRSKYPVNMGTLLWQFNDCWPVTSWSITDYSKQPKAGWYAVKEAYRDDILHAKDPVYPKDLKMEKPEIKLVIKDNTISVSSNIAAKYIYLWADNDDTRFSDNYFDLSAGETKLINLKWIIALKKPFIASESFNTVNFKVKTLYDVLNDR